MTKNILIETLNQCVSGWGNDFVITIEQEEPGRTYDYYTVSVKHGTLDIEFVLLARIVRHPSQHPGTVEMTTHDTQWHALDKGTLFAGMWFATASQLRSRRLQDRRTQDKRG